MQKISQRRYDTSVIRSQHAYVKPTWSLCNIQCEALQKPDPVTVSNRLLQQIISDVNKFAVENRRLIVKHILLDCPDLQSGRNTSLLLLWKTFFESVDNQKIIGFIIFTINCSICYLCFIVPIYSLDYNLTLLSLVFTFSQPYFYFYVNDVTCCSSYFIVAE